MLVLVLVALASFLPGLTSLPPQDRDEPRFAQASKQMLETGDFVDIRFGDEARNKKPVGIYWLQAAAVRAGELAGVADARRTIWLYRLPSLVGALATVLSTYWAALALTSRRNALLAALLLASTALLGIEARLATTDAVVAATVAATMGALARAFAPRDPDRRLDHDGREHDGLRTPVPTFRHHAPGWGVGAVFWVALGIGVLVKGPITPMVPLFAAVLLSIRERGARWLLGLRPLAGSLVCLALVLPWFVLILARTHGGFLSESVGHDMLGKVAGAQEQHGLPPGSYLAAFWLSGWPLAPFVALAAPAVWRGRRETAIAFLLAWLVPSWLLFEAVPTKLFHYVLPLYPALAILAVIGLDRALAQARASPLARLLFFSLMAIVPVAVPVAALVLRPLVFTLTPLTLGVGAVATLAALGLAGRATLALGRQALVPAVLFGVASAIPVYVFGLGLLPSASVARAAAMSPRLVEAARGALGPPCPEPTFATVGDREPSLMFLTGRDLLMTDAAGAARFLSGGACRVAFVAMASDAEFSAARAPDDGVRLADRVRGIALNGGKPLDIGVYVRQ